MLMLIFPIAALAKIYQYTFTSELNFGIMNYIKDGLYSDTMLTLKSYTFPIRIYSFFKFLGFQTHLEWSIFYTVIFTVIIFCFLLKYKKYTKLEYIYIYSSMFILCWTVMNMNKDLIQLMFMLIIFAICSSKMSSKNKILISAGVFLLESIVFREYYIIIAGLTVLVFFIINKELKSNKKKRFLLNIVLIFSFFFIGIFICQYIAPNAFDQLINRRDELENMEGVTTLIKNMILGENFLIYICNYIINFFRILFPVEIIKYGFKYIIFFLYQILTTTVLLLALRKLNRYNAVYVSIIIAYTIMLAASESDFGTLIRHQSVLFLFYIALFKRFSKQDCSRYE